MKFSQMVYERPDIEKAKVQLTDLIAKLESADTYETAREAMIEEDQLERHVQTAMTLAHVRHTIDTTDAFYDEEMKFNNNAEPVLTEYIQKWNEALLKSRFRPQFEKEFGTLMFVNAEMAQKTFAPEIIPMLQEENELKTEY